MAPKQLKCFVVGCNNEHSSRNFLPTSEPLKTQWITFVFEENAPPIYLNNLCLRESFVIQLHLQTK